LVQLWRWIFSKFIEIYLLNYLSRDKKVNIYRINGETVAIGNFQTTEGPALIVVFDEDKEKWIPKKGLHHYFKFKNKAPKFDEINALIWFQTSKKIYNWKNFWPVTFTLICLIPTLIYIKRWNSKLKVFNEVPQIMKEVTNNSSKEIYTLAYEAMIGDIKVFLKAVLEKKKIRQDLIENEANLIR
jgi:hypothetical protein